MISHILSLALVAIFCVVPVLAGNEVTTRPPISPAFDLEGMAKVLADALPKQNFTRVKWAAGWIPQACKSEAESNNITYSDFNVYEVTYGDCRAPWIFCIQKTAPQSADQIFSTFGQMPVGLRSLMSNLIAFGNVSGIPPGFVFGDVLGVGPGWWNPGLLAHELNHALDGQVCNDKLLGKSSEVTQGCQKGDFSSSTVWREAQEKDTVLPTGYAKTNLAEDFAEIGRLSLTNKNIGGGLAELNNNTKLIQNQLDIYEQSFGALIYPALGRCVDKVKSSSPVDVSGSLRLRQMIGGSKPDVSIPPGINERVYKREWNSHRIEDHFGPPDDELERVY